MASCALLHSPAGQLVGAGAPSSQYVPGKHGLHAVWPSAPWYLPASQLMHAPKPGALPYVPAGQGLCASAPSSQYEPISHSRQSVSLTPPDRNSFPLKRTRAVWLL